MVEADPTPGPSSGTPQDDRCWVGVGALRCLKSLEQVQPAGVSRFDQVYLPAAQPSLDLFFSFDGGSRISRLLEVNELGDIVFGGESISTVFPMLLDSTDEIVCYSDVECAFVAGHDVDVVLTQSKSPFCRRVAHDGSGESRSGQPSPRCTTRRPPAQVPVSGYGAGSSSETPQDDVDGAAGRYLHSNHPCWLPPAHQGMKMRAIDARKGPSVIGATEPE